MSWYWVLLIGIVIGWLTKSPFLIKYYKRIRADKQHMKEIVERVEKSDLERRRVTRSEISNNPPPSIH